MVGLGAFSKKRQYGAQSSDSLQVMPFIEDEVLNKLEENIQNIRSVTSMLDHGHTFVLLVFAASIRRRLDL